MISIDVVAETDLWSKKIKKKDIFFNSLVRFFQKKYRFIKKKISLTVLLSDNKSIKKLNNKFRNKNKSTDVLSFPFLSNKDFRLSKEKNIYIGDIATSFEIIKGRSKKSSFDIEFDKVWIHGLLHLIGYDHIKNKDYILIN